MNLFQHFIAAWQALTQPQPPAPRRKVHYPPAPDFSHLPEHQRPIFNIEEACGDDGESSGFLILTAEHAGFDDRYTYLTPDESETFEALGGFAYEPEAQAFLASVWQTRIPGWTEEEQREARKAARRAGSEGLQG